MKRITAVVLITLASALALSAQAPNPPAQPPAAPPIPANAPGNGGSPRMPQPAMHPMAVCPMLAFRVASAPFITRFQDELNLSEDQRAKVKTALDKYQAKTTPILEKSREGMQALQESLYASDFDQAKTKEAAAKSLKDEETLMNASIELWADFRSILTKEQNQKLAEFMNRGPGGRPVTPPPPVQSGTPATAPAAGK